MFLPAPQCSRVRVNTLPVVGDDIVPDDFNFLGVLCMSSLSKLHLLQTGQHCTKLIYEILPYVSSICNNSTFIFRCLGVCIYDMIVNIVIYV